MGDEVDCCDVDLHGLALQLVLKWLPTKDLVTVGQVCRLWRKVARDPFAWRHRHAPDLNRIPQRCDVKEFVRVVYFAPYVHKMSVEQPEVTPTGRWISLYENLGNEIYVRPRGLRIRFCLDEYDGKVNVTPPWLHNMLRRVGPHLQMLEVENPGPEDVAVIREILSAEEPRGPRILHSRTWEDKLFGVEAWPASHRPTFDTLHLSLIFAGKELVRVFGLTATRLELEVEIGGHYGGHFEQVDLQRLADGHVKEIALLREHGASDQEVKECAKQVLRVQTDIPGCMVSCSSCLRKNLCRCG